MSDLDHALRELLTDERLDIPARRDAVRIVQDGVRRRRRRRTIATATVTATTAGVAVAAALTVPALLTAGADRPSLPTQPRVHYDVAWVDKPAPEPWSPKPVQPKPPTMNAPRCLASQLHVGDVYANGATGMYFVTIPLRNISNEACLLVGTPPRVAAQSPGKSDVVATRGLHLGSGGVGGDLQPGKRGYLTMETDRDCPERYANPETFPSNNYSSVSVTLPSGTSFSLPVKLDVFCGLHTGGLGVKVPPSRTPADPRDRLRPTITQPAHVRSGQTLVYVVTLTNPTDSTISMQHCPGYVESLRSAALVVAKESLALNCSTLRDIAPGQSVRYEMRLEIPADIVPGPAVLSWSLETGLGSEASIPVVVDGS